MKKIVLFILTVCLCITLFSVTSCTSTEDIPKKKLYDGTITIGTETWPGYIGLYIADKKGFFAEEGLDVKIKRYVALGELSDDYVGGEMQGRANLVLDAVNEAYEGLDHKIVLAIDHSTGSDAIVASPSVQITADVKGKHVGYEAGTLEEFFVVWMLQEVGLSLDDIISVEGNPEETAHMLQNGEIDVAVSHEPFLSRVVTSEDVHILYSSKDTPGLITDILTFRTDFIEAYPDSIDAIIHAYFRGLTFLEENPDEAHQILADEFSDTAEGIAEQLQGVTLLDEKDNKDAFAFAAGLDSIYGNARRMGKFVREQRGETESIDTDEMITKKYMYHFTKVHTAEHE